jgi:hypothetical protein
VRSARPRRLLRVQEPDADTTGVPSGTSLTTVSGNQTITTPGTVLEDLDIYGRVIVRTTDVTIRNCRIRGNTATTNTGVVECTHSAVRRLQVLNCTIVPDAPSYWVDGIFGHDFFAYKCDIYHVVDGFGVFNTNDIAGPLRTWVDRCYVHDLAYFSPDPNHGDNMTHNDCLQIQGGSGLKITNSSFHASFSTADGVGDRPLATGSTAQLANMMVTPVTTSWTIADMDITDNWFYGGRISVNVGDNNNLSGTNLGRMWRNKFDRTQALSGHTIDLQAGLVCDTGDGTTNKNVYMDDLSEVTVRHNA